MLITHLKPDQVLGKKVYDNDGRLLGVVVGITGRRGRVKAVVLSNRQKAFRPLAALSNLVSDACAREYHE